ncbi:glycosyltransferase [Gracilibacillus salinarum]|uniref:Glycosyltransferase n=1 Tax=Gracilibacillus salinarum TaxID=2932255 RepID=A0ABY4GRJ3_9BACI|nr:glycosyltransferase [Gracilibacillus salinarum]UOQ87011.1 glycosyltransferase [Gracilibacillus salinarum]
MNVGGFLRICVTGPVNTNQSFGGVAIFTESLADAFKELGHEVLIVTDYSETKETIKNSSIISVGKKSMRKNLFMHYKLRKKIIEFSPNILISSLEYGFVNSFIKKNIDNCTTIHYLHAFPSIRRKLIDAFFLFLGSKMISSKSDFVISNSGLTSVINSEIFNTKSDCIINVGLGYDFIENLKESNVKKTPSNNEFNILYAGRLVKEKNVDFIIKGFESATREIKDKVVKLNIVGDGPEKTNLHELVRNLGIETKVVFHGKVDPQKITNFYLESNLFISLNPHEPYGIVYLEALTSGCKIICPMTGGQMDTLIDYREYVNVVNPYDSNDISKAIFNTIYDNNIINEPQKLIANFSYIEVAKQIEFFIKKQIKIKSLE